MEARGQSQGFGTVDHRSVRGGCISLTHTSEVISRLLEPFGSEIKQSQPFSEWETDFIASCNMLLVKG